jgi:hypothetical protein
MSHLPYQEAEQQALAQLWTGLVLAAFRCRINSRQTPPGEVMCGLVQRGVLRGVRTARVFRCRGRGLGAKTGGGSCIPSVAGRDKSR